MKTTIVELHVVARLDDGDCAADLFGLEIYYDAHDGLETGGAVTAFWESVVLDSARAGLDELDAALTTAGYQRTGTWSKRVTAAGAVRYFTNATVAVCEEVR